MNKFIRGYRCTVCGKFFLPSEADMTCPLCGEKGILDVEYDYDALKEVLTKEYFEKNRDYSMWRYAPMMGIEENHINKMLRIGWTPLVKSYNLSKELGLKELYIKDDGLNPSGSSKDRASGVAVLKAIESGARDIYGTYIHGIFDNDNISDIIIESISQKKGLSFSKMCNFDYSEFKEKEYDKLADLLRNNINMKEIYNILDEQS